jgi:hypothetical protein
MRQILLLMVVLTGCATTSAPPGRPPADSKDVPPSPPAPVATALHLAGSELPPAPDSAGPPGTLVDGTYEVCLDANRRVGRVTTVQRIPGADDAVIAALRTWSWLVVIRGDRLDPLCFDVAVRLAVPGKSQIVHQAGHGVQAQLLHGPEPRPSPFVSMRYAGQAVHGTYKVCVGEEGLVQTVHPIVSVPEIDDILAAMLRGSSWTIIAPTLTRAPYCFAAPLNLDFTGLAPPQRGAPPEVLSLKETPHGAEPGVSTVVGLKPIAHALPHLSDATKVAMRGRSFEAIYRICTGPDGSVSVDPIQPAPRDDEAIVSTLRSWRYAVTGPLSGPICSVARFQFTLQ